MSTGFCMPAASTAPAASSSMSGAYCAQSSSSTSTPLSHVWLQCCNCARHMCSLMSSPNGSMQALQVCTLHTPCLHSPSPSSCHYTLCMYATTPLVTSVCKQCLDWDLAQRAPGVTAENYTWAHSTEEQLGVLYSHRGVQEGFTDSQSMEAFVPQIFGALYFGYCLAPANQPLSCSMFDGMPNAGSTLPDGHFCDRWSVAMLAVLAAAHPPQPSSA